MPQMSVLSSSDIWVLLPHLSLQVIISIHYCLLCLDLGSAYGTAKSGVGICSMGVTKSELILKSTVPVIMAGILGVYGLIVSVILNTRSKYPSYFIIKLIVTEKGYTWYLGYKHLASGLCCGLSSLAAGLAIGITGDAGVRANAHQPKIYVGMLLMLIFSEALGLYGLIISLILTQWYDFKVKYLFYRKH